MQVTELKNEGLKREFKITLEAEDLSKRVDAKIANIAKKTKMPGFRVGKVPFDIVKKRHGKGILGEVVENAVADTSKKLLKERNLSPVLLPKVEVASFSEGGDLVYNLSFEIYPKIPEFDLSKIKLNRPKVDVTSRDVGDALERLQKSQKQFKPLEKQRAAKNGDAVIIDFEGSINGVKFEGGTASDHKLELGSGSFIKGFEEQLEGAKKDEQLEVKVKFPENYGNAELSGKAALFAVKIKDILQAEIPDVNDEMAKKLGFETLDKLKEAISNQIENDFERLAKLKLKKDLFDKLNKEYNFDVPDGMVELEYNGIIETDSAEVKEGSKEDKKRKEEYRAVAIRRVKLGMLLAEFSRINNITVTEDELRRAVLEQIRRFPGQEQKVIEFYQNNRNAVDQLRAPILEAKVVDYITGRIILTDKKISTKDLLEIDQE